MSEIRNVSLSSLVLLCIFSKLSAEDTAKWNNIAEKLEPVERSKSKRLSISQHYDYGACLNNFEISENTIIRTQDSRALGAKFLNETENKSKEELLKLCCETDYCNVVVLEEKDSGSGYLFDCGPPDDFKCKFTSHSRYTSAILSTNRHSFDLGNWGSQNKHEEELTRLRIPDQLPVKASTSSPPAPTTLLPGTPSPKATPQEKATTKPTVAAPRCKRFQFECHKSGECIAIYNACDGIPQCRDGSDESLELGCPKPDTTAVPTPKQTATSAGFPSDKKVSPSHQEQQALQLLPQHQGHMFQEQLPLPQPQPQLPPQRPLSSMASQKLDPQQPPSMYGREGEYGPNPPSQWTDYQQHKTGYNHNAYHSNNHGYEDEASHIFSHKNSGVMENSDRFYGGPGSLFGVHQAKNHDPVQPDGFNRISPQLGEDMYQNRPYYNPGYEQHPQEWHPQKPRQKTGMEHDMEEAQYHDHINHNSRVMPQSAEHENNQYRLHPPGYYYDDGHGENGHDYHDSVHVNSKQKGRKDYPGVTPYGNYQKGYSNKKTFTSNYPDQKFAGKHQVQVKQYNLDRGHPEVTTYQTSQSQKLPSNTDKITKDRPSEAKGKTKTVSKMSESKQKLNSTQADHRINQLHVSLAEVEVEAGERSSQSSGAVLALTLGLSITALLLVLVGCRLQMVRRRLLRRGSKSPYAHDADYLVNGMYL